MAENMIFGLMGQAMREIGAIGKNSKNAQQGFFYRGIDAVQNALNPVLAKLGLFICPEVLEQTREERQTKSGNTLLYSILKVKFTIYAPDGSNVSCVVIGEGMDSGDKASNKAMSVALKYACFELFMIPTEEMAMCDPDAETHEVAPKRKPAPVKQDAPAKVTQVATIPADPAPPVLEFLAGERETLRKVREMTKANNNALWNLQIKALQDAGLAPVKPLAEFTQEEAKALVQAMYSNFAPTGTVLKNDGKTA
jgi:hypothetical protein